MISGFGKINHNAEFCILLISKITLHPFRQKYKNISAAQKFPINVQNIKFPDPGTAVYSHPDHTYTHRFQNVSEHYIFIFMYQFYPIYIDGLVQNSSDPFANALELLQFCTKPLIWSNWNWDIFHRTSLGYATVVL